MGNGHGNMAKQRTQHITLARLATVGKWVWRAFLVYQVVGPFAGFPALDRLAAVNFLVSAEQALTNNVPDPIAFAFFVGLLFSTWIFPSIWKLIRTHLEPETPLEIVFDPQDPSRRFVMEGQVIDQQGNSIPQLDSTTYVFGLHNKLRDRTLENVRYWWDGDQIIRRFSRNASTFPSKLAIDPLDTVLFHIVTIAKRDFEDSKVHDPHDSLSKVQRFTLEARAHHARPVTAEFEYDPTKTPMMRRVV